jgi:hypothetical protein
MPLLGWFWVGQQLFIFLRVSFYDRKKKKVVSRMKLLHGDLASFHKNWIALLFPDLWRKLVTQNQASAASCKTLALFRCADVMRLCQVTGYRGVPRWLEEDGQTVALKVKSTVSIRMVKGKFQQGGVGFWSWHVIHYESGVVFNLSVMKIKRWERIIISAEQAQNFFLKPQILYTVVPPLSEGNTLHDLLWMSELWTVQTPSIYYCFLQYRWKHWRKGWLPPQEGWPSWTAWDFIILLKTGLYLNLMNCLFLEFSIDCFQVTVGCG